MNLKELKDKYAGVEGTWNVDHHYFYGRFEDVFTKAVEQDIAYINSINNDVHSRSGGPVFDLIKPVYVRHPEPNAVCVVIENEEGKVLGVCRRGTTDQWGLPGGSVEKNEDPRAATIRELAEETKIEADEDELTWAFQGFIGDCDVRGYLLNYTWDSYMEKYYPPQQGDAGPVGWITWQQLFDGTFGDYNRKLYEHVQRIK